MLTTIDHAPERAKQIIHSGARWYGWLTADGRLLPSFLICGGQRCGTTSLYRALAAHPAVVKAVLHKGVHYFDTQYHRGPRWYRAHFPLRRHAELVAARHGAAACTFESSPYYMYHPRAIARIANDLPEVRLVLLLRDPVERAYSHHAHELARGFETEPSFARALELEPHRLAGESDRLRRDPRYYSFAHQHHAYRARGEYVDYLTTMAASVDRSRLHVVYSEEYFTQPKPVYDGILDFLGLPRLDYPDFGQHNARPRANPMDQGVRAELRAHYQPYNQRLADWLGRTPTWG